MPTFERLPARYTVLTICIVLLAVTCIAPPQSVAVARELSSSATVSLLTVLPGDQVYSMFGHSAFYIADPQRGIDRVYNYGTFNFNEPGFILKFIRRELDYSLAVTRKAFSIIAYKRENRPIIEQTLNLTHEQKQELFVFLEHNYLPENRHYRYDFFFDNCSTRLRDALQEVLGPRIEWDSSLGRGKSYREMLDPYAAYMPFLDVGFDIALGLESDREADYRGIMFLPDYLMEALDSARVYHKGTFRPLVLEKKRLFDYTVAPPEAWSVNPIAAGLWLVFLIVAVFSYRGYRKAFTQGTVTPRRHWGDALLFGIVGFVGCLLLFLWFETAHAVAHKNFNLIWALPSHLLFAPLLLSTWRARWMVRYLQLSALASLLFILFGVIIPQGTHYGIYALAAILLLRSLWLAWAIARQESARPGKATPSP